MEKSGKRGKIPQSDWPLIMARYDSGETLASIARTYDCSPPAISYVVSRSRARQSDTEPPPTPPAPSATAPQLIKAAASDPTVGNGAQAPTVSTAPVNGQASERRAEIWPREANGFARGGDSDPPGMAPSATLPAQRPPVSGAPSGAANGDNRRTLHLSLGQTSQNNDDTASDRPHRTERNNFAGEAPATQQHFAPHQAAGERLVTPANPGSLNHTPAPSRGRDGVDGLSEARSPAYPDPGPRVDGDGGHRREGVGSYIDKDLRARVDGDIAVFLAAFDAALAEDSQESRSALREATDRLLRAGARTRIELERLEARTPLPPRDNIAGGAAWRHR